MSKRSNVKIEIYSTAKSSPFYGKTYHPFTVRGVQYIGANIGETFGVRLLYPKGAPHAIELKLQVTKKVQRVMLRDAVDGKVVLTPNVVPYQQTEWPNDEPFTFGAELLEGKGEVNVYVMSCSRYPGLSVSTSLCFMAWDELQVASGPRKALLDYCFHHPSVDQEEALKIIRFKQEEQPLMVRSSEVIVRPRPEA